MSHIARFAEYASAFEMAVASDDWSRLEPFLTEDVVYEIGLPLLGAKRCEGRAELLAWFKQVLDSFDRRFATRELKLLEGPREQGDEVWIRGVALYSAAGVPDFALELEETARFEGERICRLEDRYTPEMREVAEAYLQEHGEKLGIGLDFEASPS